MSLCHDNCDLCYERGCQLSRFGREISVFMLCPTLTLQVLHEWKCNYGNKAKDGVKKARGSAVVVLEGARKSRIELKRKHV